MKKYFKRKPRIEKKFTKRAMELLLKLIPSQYKEDSFYLDVNEWCWGEFDYWGEFDSYDSFFELHKNLITMTTDWENLYRAGENNEDKTPYFSPWRINYKVGRREVISHCHKLVKAGVVWG